MAEFPEENTDLATQTRAQEMNAVGVQDQKQGHVGDDGCRARVGFWGQEAGHRVT